MVRHEFWHSEGNNKLPRGTKNDRIYRILLCNPEGTLTKYRIARLSGAQQIQVSLLLHRLEEDHLVKGTRVTDYNGLMRRWSSIRIRYRSQSYMLPRILKVLRKSDMEYALTTYQAESIVNGYLFPSRIEFYVCPDDLNDWHKMLVKEGALVGGGNVKLRSYDKDVLHNNFAVKGYRIVTIPQLIADLLREGSSAVEAAEMMIGKYMDFLQLNRIHVLPSSPLVNGSKV